MFWNRFSESGHFSHGAQSVLERIGLLLLVTGGTGPCGLVGLSLQLGTQCVGDCNVLLAKTGINIILTKNTSRELKNSGSPRQKGLQKVAEFQKDTSKPH